MGQVGAKTDIVDLPGFESFFSSVGICRSSLPVLFTLHLVGPGYFLICRRRIYNRMPVAIMAEHNSWPIEKLRNTYPNFSPA